MINPNLSVRHLFCLTKSIRIEIHGHESMMIFYSDGLAKVTFFLSLSVELTILRFFHVVMHNSQCLVFGLFFFINLGLN